MTDTILLRQEIDKRGLKLRWLAEQIGITYQALLNKINNVTDFKANEIQTLSDTLNLSPQERDNIFFHVK